MIPTKILFSQPTVPRLILRVVIVGACLLLSIQAIVVFHIHTGNKLTILIFTLLPGTTVVSIEVVAEWRARKRKIAAKLATEKEVEEEAAKVKQAELDTTRRAFERLEHPQDAINSALKPHSVSIDQLTEKIAEVSSQLGSTREEMKKSNFDLKSEIMMKQMDVLRAIQILATTIEQSQSHLMKAIEAKFDGMEHHVEQRFDSFEQKVPEQPKTARPEVVRREPERVGSPSELTNLRWQPTIRLTFLKQSGWKEAKLPDLQYIVDYIVGKSEKQIAETYKVAPAEVAKVIRLNIPAIMATRRIIKEMRLRIKTLRRERDVSGIEPILDHEKIRIEEPEKEEEK